MLFYQHMNERPPGIFCLEGQWGTTLDDPTSVRGLLECLSDATKARMIYKDVHTREEFYFLLDKFSQRGYAKYKVLWLAFHGSRGALHIGSTAVSLDDLAERYAGKFAGRVLYFASCSTMKTAKTSDLAMFCKTTGARAVIGYTKNVYWFEAAAFELLLLSELTSSTRLDHLKKRLEKNYGELPRLLGFRMVRATDAEVARSG